MEIAKLKVDGVYAGVVMRMPVTAGLVGATIEVEYAAGIWEGLTKTVVFRGATTKDVVTNDTTIEIPWEVLTKPNERLQVGFYGVDDDEKQIIPTIWADLGRIQPGADPSGDPSTDPSLPVWGQIADRVEGIAQDVEELKQGGGPSTPGADCEDGGYYIPELSQPDEDTIQFAFKPSKADMPAVEPFTVELPAGQGSGGNVEYVGVEPAEDDIPKVFFGSALPQTKNDTVMSFRYISKTEDIRGYCKTKAQGNSSMNYPKKNQTVKLYKDAGCTEKLKVDFKGWGEQNKLCFKANWIDLTHARNVVSARLWADVVKSRADYAELPELLRTSPNQGVVDGFPVKVYAGGVYQGRYTINIPKDAWMANMDDELDNHCILCGENYVSGCFRAEANIDESDWTDEIHDTVPEPIKTRWNDVISFVMNSTDEDFRENLGNYFDVQSLIDYYLFGLVSCGLDAFGKNQLYMTYDGQKWIAQMYDMDSTWGLWWTGASFVPTDYKRTEFQDFKDGEGNLLYIRLEKLFVSEIQSRWEELKSSVLSVENIFNRFERFTDICPPWLITEDYADTTADGTFVGIPSQSTNNIQQIRSYVKNRSDYVDKTVGALVRKDDQIDYNLDALNGVTWVPGKRYNKQTGELENGNSTNYLSDKFELQGCRYVVTIGSTCWLHIWDENDNYIGCYDNVKSGTTVYTKKGYKAALYAFNASDEITSAATMLPEKPTKTESATLVLNGETSWKTVAAGVETAIQFASSGYARCSHLLMEHNTHFGVANAPDLMFGTYGTTALICYTIKTAEEAVAYFTEHPTTITFYAE